MATLNVATTDAWKDRQSGQLQERTEWHRVVLFNRLAEIAQQYLGKGGKVYIEGRLQTRKWQDQTGQDRFSTEVVGSDLQMLDSRGTGGGGGDTGRPTPPPSNQGQGQGGQRSNAYQAARGGNAPPSGTAGGPPPGSFDDFDDQIPY